MVASVDSVWQRRGECIAGELDGEKGMYLRFLTNRALR